MKVRLKPRLVLKGHLGTKTQGGNKSPADMELINPTVADISGTGEHSYEREPYIKAIQLKTFGDVQALLLSGDETVQESDEEEVFEAGEDMDEDTQADTKVQSPSPNTDKPESFPIQDTDESTSDSSPDLKKFDNILPFAERQLVKFLRKVSRVLFNKITKTQWAQHEEAVVSYVDLKAAIEGYYEENINHIEQTNKDIDAAMNSLDKNSIARSDLINALNGVTKALKAIQDVVRKTVSEISSLGKDTLDIKSMMTEIYQSFKEPPSHTKGEHDAMEEEPTNAVPITTVKPTEIPTLEVQPITTIISTSQPESYVPQREGKAIVTDDQPEDQRKLVHASKEIQAHLDKEEKVKKAAEEAKLFEMTNTEVVKVVQEEAEKIGLNLKKIISAKAGEKFKKAQDTEHQVLKREHSHKAKRSMELRMKRVEQYMWIMSNRLKPEPITNVKIYPNIKPAVLTMYRNNDKRNFEVHNPFKFGDFGISELDESGPIIEKKKNFIIKDLMTSLEKRYEKLKKIPEELGIQSALHAPVPGQVASQSSRRKRKHMELEHEIKVPGLECNRSLPDGVPFVNNMVIEEPEYDSLVSYLVIDSMVKTQENARFGLKLRKLIAEQPDQKKLQSKKVKLEALGYKLDQVVLL
ncbi:hypothetical protein Tco_0532107 [Tanacetum coccineum]